MKYEQPNAKDAKISQRAQKDSKKFLMIFFCDLCESFASSAFGGSASGHAQRFG